MDFKVYHMGNQGHFTNSPLLQKNRHVSETYEQLRPIWISKPKSSLITINVGVNLP